MDNGSPLPLVLTARPDDPRAWVRVARALLADIEDGTLKPGDQLPGGITGQGVRFGVNMGTISKACHVLMAAGLMTCKRGHPFRVASDPPGPRAEPPAPLAERTPAAPQPPAAPEPAPRDAQFLTVLECATQARVARMTIYRLIHNGTVNSTRAGQSIRIYAGSWAAYLRQPPGQAGTAAAARVTEPGQPPGNQGQGDDFPPLIPVFRSP